MADCENCGRQIKFVSALEEEAPPVPLAESEMLALPVDRLRPMPPLKWVPAPMVELTPGGVPVAPAHLVCGASTVRARAGQMPEDFTHKGSAECQRLGCPLGMCQDHIFTWEWRGTDYKMCWRCYRDIRRYKEGGHEDPFLTLIREEYPDLADWIDKASTPALAAVSNSARLGMRRRILVKFPTRGRPERFMAALTAWRKLASGQHEVNYLVTLDADDASMNTPDIQDRLYGMQDVEFVVGQSASKIEACNRDMDGRRFDVLLLASDDMMPQVQNWDDVVVGDMETAFPNWDGALHYFDGFRRDIITLSVMGGNLYKLLGHVYHPDYQSLWCDNEFTEVAKRLGKYASKDTLLALHQHPAFGAGPRDDLYLRNDKLYARDRAVFEARKLRDFDLVQPRLSVLIPTLPEREMSRGELLAELNRQHFALPRPADVEIRVLLDEGQATTGAKRNQLLASARGAWVCFVDDDDLVAPTYLADVLAALAEGPDCVTFEGRMTEDGAPKLNWQFKLGCKDGEVIDDVLQRAPNHLCPIRVERARAATFPDASMGEDAAWATQLALTTEVSIDKVLYHYRSRAAGSGRRRLRLE